MEKPWFKNYPEHLPRELDTLKIRFFVGYV